jgi:hypothetical protein
VHPTRSEIIESIRQANAAGHCAACGAPAGGERVTIHHRSGDIIRTYDLACCRRHRCAEWFSARARAGELPEAPTEPSPATGTA